MIYEIQVNFKKVRPHCDYFTTVLSFEDEAKATATAKLQTLPCKVVATDHTPACYGGVADKVIYKNF